jgi:Zn-dependent peptidase ImmA (M78 family)
MILEKMTDKPKQCAKSVATMARDYDVSKAFIYRELQTGRLKAKRFGGKTLITAEQEREWIASKPEWTPMDER